MFVQNVNLFHSLFYFKKKIRFIHCFILFLAFASVFGNKYIFDYPLIPLAAIQTFCGFTFAFICSYFFDYWIPPNGFEKHYNFFLQTSWQVIYVYYILFTIIMLIIKI